MSGSPAKSVYNFSAIKFGPYRHTAFRQVCREIVNKSFIFIRNTIKYNLNIVNGFFKSNIEQWFIPA